jgi:cystathionine gamma-synthase
MVVLKTQSEYGYAPPPQTQHSIITNLSKWEDIRKFRDGDPTPMMKLHHMYPRFSPRQTVAKVSSPYEEPVLDQTDSI